MHWCFKMSFELPAGTLSFAEKWPLMYPGDILFCLLTYLAFVLIVGPILMEERRAFQMKWFLVCFNAIKVINAGYLTYKFFLYISDKGLFPRSCDHDKITIYTIAALYWKYMVTKVVDLFDTVFCVMRKKHTQITFLHVYHHAFMVIITWACLKYDPSDHWAFMALMNCAIHTVMYAYYGIAALGPACAKYLWWKKYLTMIQLIQFVLVMCHVLIQSYTSDCPISTATYWVGLANLTLFLCLFSDFYQKRYLAKACEEGPSASKTADFACLSHPGD